MYRRTTCVKILITTSCGSGSAKWIKNNVSLPYSPHSLPLLQASIWLQVSWTPVLLNESKNIFCSKPLRYRLLTQPTKSAELIWPDLSDTAVGSDIPPKYIGLPWKESVLQETYTSDVNWVINFRSLILTQHLRPPCQNTFHHRVCKFCNILQTPCNLPDSTCQSDCTLWPSTCTSDLQYWLFCPTQFLWLRF